MAYRKSFRGYTGRKRTMRRPRYTTMGSAKFLAQRALQGIRQLKGIINSEKKYIDTSVTMAPQTSGEVQSLVQLAQGDTNISRSGNSIMAKSVYFKGNIQFQSTGGAAQIVKCYVVLDNQQVGDTSPTFTTIFENSNVNSFINSDSGVGRFSILKKWDAVYDSARPLVPFEHYISLGNHHIRYNGTGSFDINKGGIYLVAVSNVGATGTPAVVVSARVCFYDN